PVEISLGDIEMKFLGWLLFLITIGIGLILYNLYYLPLQVERKKLAEENLMWQNQLKELQSKLNTADTTQVLFSQTFLWDDLFLEPNSFTISEPAQVILKDLIPTLQATDKAIIVAGHSDNQPISPELKKTYPTDRELSFAKAMAVVKFLEAQGIKKERIVCIGYGATSPIDSGVSEEAYRKNRRVEIIVKNR
ncbi:MAG: OmpA family protein, partial [candidate division WOR-3 bacterium]|nr:OmpA family protein [candidate division WOR-3 bacterium]